MINPYFNGDDNIKIKYVECGRWHSLCLDEKVTVYMFGDNETGKCGNGTKSGLVRVPYCNNNNDSKLKDVIFVSGSYGGEHTALSTNDGKVCTFGSNN